MQHRLVPLLRQSVYSRLAGYEDTNEAERLVRHARRLVFQLAKVAVPLEVFQGVLERIGR